MSFSLVQDYRKDHGYITVVDREIESDETGELLIRQFVSKDDVVVVVPIDEHNQVICLAQYRAPLDEVCFELPAGNIDEGETPEDAARREVLEETSHEVQNLQYYGAFATSQGYSDEITHYFAASVVKGAYNEPLDAEERDMQLVYVPADKMSVRRFTGSQSALAWALIQGSVR